MLDGRRVELVEQLLARAIELDVRLEHGVEGSYAGIDPRRAGRHGARRWARARSWSRDELPPGALVQVRARRYTSVLNTSFRSAKPPTMSPYSVA